MAKDHNNHNLNFGSPLFIVGIVGVVAIVAIVLFFNNNAVYGSAGLDGNIAGEGVRTGTGISKVQQTKAATDGLFTTMVTERMANPSREDVIGTIIKAAVQSSDALRGRNDLEVLIFLPTGSLAAYDERPKDPDGFPTAAMNLAVADIDDGNPHIEALPILREETSALKQAILGLGGTYPELTTKLVKSSSGEEFVTVSYVYGQMTYLMTLGFKLQ